MAARSEGRADRKSSSSEQAELHGNGTALVLSSEPPDETESIGLKSWALIELFGHNRIVGLIAYDPPELPGMIRVDVPDLLKKGELVRKGHTRYLNPKAVYAVNPCDESTVRNLLPHVDGLPIRPMSFREYRDDSED